MYGRKGGHKIYPGSRVVVREGETNPIRLCQRSNLGGHGRLGRDVGERRGVKMVRVLHPHLVERSCVGNISISFPSRSDPFMVGTLRVSTGSNG